jgi:glycine C-acetyltransferase
MPKNPHAKALSALGAKKGGKARASVLSPEERRDSAREAVEQRWRKAGKLKKEEAKPGARATFAGILDAELKAIQEAGLRKEERVLQGPQGASITVNGREVLNFCANNYLGLSSHPEVIEAAHEALRTHGYGLSSVRFICGTQDLHKRLEGAIAGFLGMDDAILYTSCFDANGGLFETLLGEQDAVISDALNHASIIDGIRLCKARRLRYANRNLAELEQHLKDTQDCRTRLIATDGVFSMDGSIAPLREICDLADKYGALVMVDDSHATGFMGAGGRGSIEHCGVLGRVDFLTGTFGKALGGGSGGYTSGKANAIAWLRQRSRPYLFSNSIPPVVAAVTLRALDMVEHMPDLRGTLFAHARKFRAGLTSAGFRLLPGEHPIIPVMIGDAALAARFADRLLSEGVYVIGFSFPVVPRGEARIRTQMSAALTDSQLDRALAAFIKVGRELEIIQ